MPGLEVEGQGQWVLGEWLALVCGSPGVELGSGRWVLWVLWVTVVASVAMTGEPSDLRGTSMLVSGENAVSCDCVLYCPWG